MNAKELMIGDWVKLDFYDTPYGDEEDAVWKNGKITAIHHGNWVDVDFGGPLNECDIDEDDVQPIPLTEEILKKNGFKPQGTGWILEDSIGERIFNLCRISNAYCLLTAGMTLAFQYVHELQHLFRLAGTKGEIKL